MPSPPLHTCSHCDFKGDDKATTDHIQTHVIWRCPACELKYSAPNSQPNPQCPAHKVVKTYRCPSCAYLSQSLASVKSHFRTHMFTKPFNCTICEFSCAQKQALTLHMKHHGMQAMYICAFCDFGHTNARTLKNHETSCHSTGAQKGSQEKVDDEAPAAAAPAPAKRPPSEALVPTKRQRTKAPAPVEYVLTERDKQNGYMLCTGWDAPKHLDNSDKDSYANRAPWHFCPEDLMIPPMLHALQKPRDFGFPIAVIKDQEGHTLCEMFYQSITIGRTRSAPNYEVDVNLEDDTVSKVVAPNPQRHGMIKYLFERTSGGQFSAYFVYISFGKNGSFVGGSFVARGRRYLPSDTLIQCGTSPVRLRFLILHQNIARAQDLLRARIEADEARREAELKAQQDW